MRDDRQRLLDIIEAIERIESRVSHSRNAFEADELIQIWVLHHLRILGEAVRALSADFRDAHPELPWSAIVGMRNILVHHYFEIDTDAVWLVLQNDLPNLKAQIRAILHADES